MPLKLYLASTNPGKLREFREAALAYGVRVEAVPGIECLPPCVEDGETFSANARKKALHYAARASGLVFADDSGICVDALGGAPGVYSARYAGPGATDEMNNQKLIAELRRTAAGDNRLALRVPIEAPPGTGLRAAGADVVTIPIFFTLPSARRLQKSLPRKSLLFPTGVLPSENYWISLREICNSKNLRFRRNSAECATMN